MNRDDAEDLWLATLLPAPAYMDRTLVRERHLSRRAVQILRRIRDAYDAGWDQVTLEQVGLPEDVLRSIPARLARIEAQTRVTEAETIIIASWAKVAYAKALRRAADISEHDGPEAADAFLWDASTKIKAESSGVDWVSVGTAVRAWLRQKIARLQQDRDDMAIGCGFPEIDLACGHWAPRRMTLVQGYTSDGKSTATLQFLDQLAICGLPGFAISLEDPPEVWGGRLVAMHIDDAELEALAALTANRHGPPEIEVVQALIQEGLEMLPLQTVWHPGWTCDQVCAAIMDAGRRGARIIAVDYVQKLIRPKDDSVTMLEIYANQMKDAASAVGAHLVLVSQIQRPPGAQKQRADLMPPTLFSARGSGGLENAAETVLSPFRPRKDMDPLFEPAKILINKAKDAATGEVAVWWDKTRHLYIGDAEKMAREGR